MGTGKKNEKKNHYKFRIDHKGNLTINNTENIYIDTLSLLLSYTSTVYG